jgi:hypothetical protein
MAKVLPGFVPGCRLGSSVMESVRVVIGRSSHSQARAWKDRLLRHGVTTYLRCSASSSSGGGRVGSSHLLCELRILLVNCHGCVFSPCDAQFRSFRSASWPSSTLRLMS